MVKSEAAPHEGLDNVFFFFFFFFFSGPLIPATPSFFLFTYDPPFF